MEPYLWRDVRPSGKLYQANRGDEGSIAGRLQKIVYRARSAKEPGCEESFYPRLAQRHGAVEFHRQGRAYGGIAYGPSHEIHHQLVQHLPNQLSLPPFRLPAAIVKRGN